MGGVFFAGYWFNSRDERKAQAEHKKLIDNIKTRFERLFDNNTCPYGINNPPKIGSVPECNNLMFWLEDGKLLALHTARSENVEYNIAQGLNLTYLYDGLESYFKQKGFIIDQPNTRVQSLWSDEYKKYSYAFTRGNLRCYWSISSINDQGKSDTSPTSIEVACGQITDNDRQIYKDFLPVINASTFADQPFWLTDREGDYGSLSAGTISSEYFLVKRIHGVWVVSFGPSQDYPMCKDIDRMGFPKSVYKNCMLDDYSLREKN